MIVAALTESDTEEIGQEFTVKPTGVTKNEYGFEVPDGYINYKIISEGPASVPEAESHMRFLVKTRNYPSGSFFITPWGTYLIHGGNIGKI